MKRVEIIHVGGMTFSMDDDARERLASYVDALGNYFKNEQGGREIIADIENRIAELLAARPGGEKAVVTLPEVEQLIATLGTVEDITGDEPAHDDDEPAGRQPRRLYRDHDARYIGGLCAGIARWAGIRVLAVRLLFILPAACWHEWPIVFLSIGAYLVACLLVPVANTTARKLEMRGRPVNVSNIEKSVREESPRPGGFIPAALRLAGRCLAVLFRIIGIGIGIWLLAAGVFIFAGTICLAFVRGLVFTGMIEWEVLTIMLETFHHVVTPLFQVILYACGMILLLLLSAACFYWGAWFMLRFTVRRRHVHVILLIAWAVVACLAFFIGLAEVQRHDQAGSVTETIAIPRADTLYLDLLPDTTRFDGHPLNIYYNKESGFRGRPTLYFTREDKGDHHLVIRKHARGPREWLARSRADQIEYRVTARDTIFLSPYFAAAPSNEWHFQSVSLWLHLPEGTIILVSEACQPLLSHWMQGIFNAAGARGLVMTKDGPRAWNGKTVLVGGRRQ
ncbi:MAG: PspC domain-containing protein [Odoribacteraceae bacterium]|jgi:phage shock protein PspC (stress-responsive transcriptional regulator)|nr:PspC domain-containing protein [Odoribacteraceae bacterium]